jgi:hypothetical protein
MSTEAQKNANKRNAQQSTGPRSPEGKTESSRNATTHGGYATRPHAIRSGAFQEDPGDVAEFVDGIVEALNPRDHVERIEARNIATGYLRLRRLQAFEADSIGGAGLKPPATELDLMLERDRGERIEDPDERRAAHAQWMIESILLNSSRIESRNTASLDRALKRYEWLHKRELPDLA